MGYRPNRPPQQRHCPNAKFTPGRGINAKLDTSWGIPDPDTTISGTQFCVTYGQATYGGGWQWSLYVTTAGVGGNTSWGWTMGVPYPNVTAPMYKYTCSFVSFRHWGQDQWLCPRIGTREGEVI